MCEDAPGNTPACAGKSKIGGSINYSFRKYPRVRGEEEPYALAIRSRSEIPPRARGRDGVVARTLMKGGNTPACAGKSGCGKVGGVAFEKYPRVRGEEADPNGSKASIAEIPPRARGRVAGYWSFLKRRGNTPACAGKRGWCVIACTITWKYPRVRGEETLNLAEHIINMEIPPRARGRV